MPRAPRSSVLGEAPRPPSHISHSARETLLRCAKAYFLSRIAKAPSRPALWLAGGSAVHEATEAYDRAVLESPEVDPPPEAIDLMWSIAFDQQLAELRAKESNESAWRWSKTEPIPAWQIMGPQFVWAYIDWRRRAPYEIWTTPDGQPAIELDISGHLPGCEVEIKAYLDRVFWDPVFEKLIIVDLKSGKRPPKNADQFATYKVLLEVKYGVKADLGVPFMNRKATLGRPYELAEFTPEVMGQVYAEAWAQVQSGKFEANGFPRECFICDVSAACAAQNGPLAERYDPDHPKWRPPF